MAELPAYIGSYKILRKLYDTGTTETYLAESKASGGFVEQVAVQRLLPALASEESFVEGFFDAIGLASALDHPHLPRVVELAGDRDAPFAALEYVPGCSLRRMLEICIAHGMWLAPEYIARMAAQICEALEYIHDARDDQGEPLEVILSGPTPEKLLLSNQGIVRMLDFEFARSNQHLSQSSLDSAGVIKGDIAYMSPEQARGRKLDGRSDLFALGIVLYELTTHTHPFRGDSDFDTLTRILKDDPKDAALIRPELPRELLQIIERALHKEREERYATAREMWGDLEAFLEAWEPLCSALQLQQLAFRLEELDDLPVQPVPPAPEPQTQSFESWLQDHLQRELQGLFAHTTHELASMYARRLMRDLELGSWAALRVQFHPETGRYSLEGEGSLGKGERDGGAYGLQQPAYPSYPEELDDGPSHFHSGDPSRNYMGPPPPMASYAPSRYDNQTAAGGTYGAPAPTPSRAAPGAYGEPGLGASIAFGGEATGSFAAPAPLGDTREEPSPILRRKGVVRYYKQMNPNKLFPLLVSLLEVEEYIKRVELRHVEQAESEKVLELHKSDSKIRIVPILPGCLVSPPEITVDVGPDKVDAQFWVNPLTVDDLSHSARVQLWHGEELKDEIALPIRVTRQTLTKISAGCSVGSSVLKAFGGAAKASKVGAGAAWSAKLSAWLQGGLQMLIGSGFLIAFGFLLLTGVFWWMLRPKKGQIIERFLHAEKH